MNSTQEIVRDLNLLEEIEQDPDTTQATLADQLGVAVGTVNWHMKRLIAKGYVKVKRAERRKLKYIITPEGISRRAKLTVAYIEQSMLLYRKVREQAMHALEQAEQQGFQQVRIQGTGDVADICRLTCLEQGMEVVTETDGRRTAVLVIDGSKVLLEKSAV
ncbi:MAG: winged helix-turn-helix transcriptional regulator [Anaerolineales bacterium]|nr:winged helix-turn-helix transcriptional regulator [Anaerolineales bacterium]